MGMGNLAVGNEYPAKGAHLYAMYASGKLDGI